MYTYLDFVCRDKPIGKCPLETDNHSPVEEICSISCNPKVHYRIYKNDTTDLYPDSLVSNLQPRNNFLRIVLMLSSIYSQVYANGLSFCTSPYPSKYFIHTHTHTHHTHTHTTHTHIHKHTHTHTTHTHTHTHTQTHTHTHKARQIILRTYFLLFVSTKPDVGYKFCG